MSENKAGPSVVTVAAGMLIMGIVIGVAGAHFLPPTGDASGLATEKQAEEANAAFIRAFFRPDFTSEQKFEALDTNYVQHNPLFREFNALNHTGGQDEYRVLQLAQAQRGPDDEPMFAQPEKGSPEWNRVYKVLADGDYVTVLSTRYSRNPLRPDEFYEHFWFDTWRMENGHLMEHWDPQTIPEDIPDFLVEPVKQ